MKRHPNTLVETGAKRKMMFLWVCQSGERNLFLSSYPTCVSSPYIWRTYISVRREKSQLIICRRRRTYAYICFDFFLTQSRLRVRLLCSPWRLSYYISVCVATDVSHISERPPSQFGFIGLSLTLARFITLYTSHTHTLAVLFFQQHIIW